MRNSPPIRASRYKQLPVDWKYRAKVLALTHLAHRSRDVLAVVFSV
jgi:hypothetical protein